MLNHLQTKRAWAQQRREQAQEIRRIRRVLYDNGYCDTEPKRTFTQRIINIFNKLKGK